MGKVVKAVAIIAVSAAIAFAAPYIATTFLGLSGVAASVAGAAIATTLSIAATALYKVLTGPPSSTRGLHPISTPLVPTSLQTSPIGKPGWRNPMFMPGQRFIIERMSGTCMLPIIYQRWAIIDRQAPVRSNDLVMIRVADQRRYYLNGAHRDPIRLWQALIRVPMIKSFTGIADNTLLFKHTNPEIHLETDLNGVDVLYRIRAVEVSFRQAVRTWWRMRRNPDAYDHRLAQAVANRG